MELSLDIGLIKDSVILIICAATCLYCQVLSTRLKRLNSAKSGIRASIAQLTLSIKDSHNATQNIQDSMEESINTLTAMIAKAESLSVKLEAVSADAEHRYKALDRLNTQTQKQIDIELPAAISTARRTASNLLTLITQLRAKQTSKVSKDSAPAPLKKRAPKRAAPKLSDVA